MRAPHAELFVHLVWSTRDRRPTITPEVEEVAFRSMVSRAGTLGADVLAIGGVADHVHVLVRVPPTLPISRLVQHLKGGSSHLVSATLPEAADFKWQGAYGAFSVFRWDLPRVCSYVRRQKQHHLDNTLSRKLEVSGKS